MEITIAEQTWMFLMSLVLGAALGACYDVFRILRIAVYNPPAVILFEDILFWMICAVATFVYMISVDSGQIRLFVLIGEMVGGVLYYCTIGTLVIGISKRLIAAIRWFCQLVWRGLIAPVLRVVESFCSLLSKILKFLAKYIKRNVKNSKLHLKRYSNLLYNLKKRLLRKRQRKKVEG